MHVDPVVDNRMSLVTYVAKVCGRVVAEAEEAPGGDHPVRWDADAVHAAGEFELAVLSPDGDLRAEERRGVRLPQVPHPHVPHPVFRAHYFQEEVLACREIAAK